LRPWLLSIVLFAGFGGWAHASSAQVPPHDDLLPQARDGRELWLRDCAVCHGDRGQGSERGPDITDAGLGGVDFMVRTGRMPIFEPDDPIERRAPQYDDEEIDQLLSYVGTFVAGRGVPVGEVEGADEAQGGELYRLHCAACHQMAGQGGALAYGVAAPSLGAATAVETVEAARFGPGTMPAFDPEALSDEELADVAAYVQVLRDPEDDGGWAIGHFGPVPEGAAAFLFGMIPIALVARWLGERQP
jgi:ubiquinol-cytochrome c reductase cytochrome c subunit